MTSVGSRDSEWLTRKRLIDPKLKAAGWQVVRFSKGESLSAYDCCAIEEFPTDNGPADYALCVCGKILGIVEAKKLTLGPQNVLTQAERYSKGATSSTLNFRGYRVPFLYSTNGEIIWHHDIRHPLSRSHTISRFHTPEALAEKIERDFFEGCQRLIKTPNEHPKLRPYQRDANTAIEKAIGDQKRQMLVAMATGTGKTFTMVNQVYRLMKAGVAQRILFLVDRRALAAQAVLAFASFAKISDFPRDLMVALLSKREGELIDQRQFLAGSRYQAEDVIFEIPEQNIEQTILLGESETVEFKRELPSKREGIAIGAVALANRHGGRILLGVTDNGEVIGCPLDKPKETITQILRSYCEPLPDFVVEEVSVRGMPVLLVKIREGKDKPYGVREKGFYIWIGATNRLATKYEVDEMYSARQNPFGQ